MKSLVINNSTVFEKEALIFFSIPIEALSGPHNAPYLLVAQEDNSQERFESKVNFGLVFHRPRPPLFPINLEHISHTTLLESSF